jgi:hypothetical protein
MSIQIVSEEKLSSLLKYLIFISGDNKLQSSKKIKRIDKLKYFSFLRVEFRRGKLLIISIEAKRSAIDKFFVK